VSDYLKKAEEALGYLARSEEDFARLKALHLAEDKRRKIVRASCFLDSDGTAAERNQKAEDHRDYRQAVEDWNVALEDFYLIDAKRKRAEITIEMFRSVNSSMKRGNI
jgi:hypothetical protein